MSRAVGSQPAVLIFRLGSIGDTVVALPCFHAIARAYPRHRRVLLTNSLTMIRASSAESVLDGTGLIDEVIYYPVGDFSFRQIWALRTRLRAIRPALLVYLADRPTAAPFLRDVVFFIATGIPRIVGGPWRKRLREGARDPATAELEYEAQRLARLLHPAIPVSLARENWDLRFSVMELSKVQALLPPSGQPMLAIAPGAKVAEKDWGRERWRELLTGLAVECREYALMLVGAPDERGLCEDLAHAWIGPVLNLCGCLTPRETAIALGRCRILVCHDSGPMHLAASQSTPCVALFGNYNRPRRWFPFGPEHRVVYEARGVRQISTERVVREVHGLLATIAGAEAANRPDVSVGDGTLARSR